jgi:hypothetical protein
VFVLTGTLAPTAALSVPINDDDTVEEHYMIHELQNLKKEAEVMKNVAGWEVGPSPFRDANVWMPRAVHELSRHGNNNKFILIIWILIFNINIIAIDTRTVLQ